MTISTDRLTVLRYVAAFNEGDLDAMPALFAPDAVIHGVLATGGLDVVLPLWRDLHDCLQAHLHVESIAQDGDQVAVRCRETGRAVRPFRGRPATGRAYEIVAMEWFVVRDGLIRGRWAARDALNQALQLGWSVPD